MAPHRRQKNVLLKNDPMYEKYLEVGLPKAVVAHEMIMEEDAISTISMDPDGPSPRFLK